ncbi:hypothetical protein [Numidum massiliense]|uniref:hypothetical protein n=1 Tax=Numidum massiliense TaxID=1522315 RepID=UPI0012F79596|nr:hypothetical protein [Numidum massiliense]
MISQNYETANLSSELLHKVQSLERELRASASRDIVLIAYEAKGTHSETLTDGEKP